MKKLLSITFFLSFVLVGCGEKPKTADELLIEKIEEKVTNVSYGYKTLSFDLFDSNYFANANPSGEINFAIFSHPQFKSDALRVEYHFLGNYTYSANDSEILRNLCSVDLDTSKAHKTSSVACTDIEIEVAQKIKDYYDYDLKDLDITTEELLHYMQLKIDEGEKQK